MSVLRRRAMMRPPDFGYVRDGLLLHLDGIYNTWGGHDPSATEWYDLSGSGNSAEVVDGVWSASSLTPNGSCVTNLKPSPNYSYEIVIRYVNGNAYSFIASMQENGTVTGSPFSMDGYSRILAQFNSVYELANSVDTGLQVDTEWTAPQSTACIFAGGTSVGNRLISTYANGNFVDAQIKGIYGTSIVDEMVKFSIGRDLRWGGFGGANEVFAVRVYDRALTAGEVARNYAIDKRRFGL